MLSLLLVSILGLALSNDLPKGTMGFYCLIADDGWAPYTSTYNWTAKLHPYQISGANVLWLTFINPQLMPAVPPAMARLAQCKGQSGCPNVTTPVIFSIGGEAYSNKQWPWLASQSAAESMAAEVAQWDTKYGADGIDLDIETGAGNSQTAANNLVAFAKKVRELNPKLYITQPVYGYPQVTAENTMINEGFTKEGGTNNLVDSAGIMEYVDLASLNYVKDYGNGTSEYQGFPIKVNVPYSRILTGIQGTASSGTITTMANDIVKEGLGGIMVWYASVMDAATGKTAFAYSGGSMDSSANQSPAWQQAMGIMTKG
mmetsp:Transcript_25861/g.22602  ORF Transcript_25861/g.22602 Transcript_25861/m.22602 type:complete len:315 (+) Transcript_25861:32-976(+)|eukprot:CAMPEP_0201580454 /NCGR_PEP_ID=MMETSP0190_2-20130828/46272_1 /ASSEMBLY_ACC=CAM_ASM_000263 /TAXON_ID=37353 /ORGANISM="Rosalina sp." /LENGTH=314 /DNA_ID=CAMNT_0048016525 /DNA_START=19 /DNA_END=963 /DNA_ORIENTATION=+